MRKGIRVLKANKNFIEVDCFQRNKTGHIACGDCFMSKKLKEEGRVITVLSDGLGSGIKASILSTMTASMALNFSALNEDIVAASLTIIKTLPSDLVRKISYSTFCICDIDYFGNVKIVEYESPSFCLYRKGGFVHVDKEIIPVCREDLENTSLWISKFVLQKEDRIIFFSDGVSQSGMGTKRMPSGWEEGVKEFIAATIRQTLDISAADLARRIVVEAGKNDGDSVKDDTSCCVIYMRKPRNLLICTGPPYDEKNDRRFSKQVQEFQGKKIICGGTTAHIIEREWVRKQSPASDELSTTAHTIEREWLRVQSPTSDELSTTTHTIAREWEHGIEPEAVITGNDLPPMSKMQGIDLVTEGILTLSKIECMLRDKEPERKNSNGSAGEVLKYLMDSDKITFLVGTRINIAHQDPTLPVELEIRRNIVKKMKDSLENKYLKEVEMVFV